MGPPAPEAWRGLFGGIALGVPCIGVLGKDFGIGMVTKVIADDEICTPRQQLSCL
jgi:hypothetical protein